MNVVNIKWFHNVKIRKYRINRLSNDREILMFE